MAKFTSTTISNYNQSPPPDDGSSGSGNLVQWAGIKTKLADAVKNYIDSVQSNAAAAFSNLYVNIEEHSSDLATAIAAIGSSPTTLVIKTSIPVTEDATVPSTLTLKFLHGGDLNISTSITVTVNGQIDAGRYQIFKGAGTVAGLSEAFPEWYGAAGDGVTDDATAIQAAIDTVSATGGRVSFAATEYLVSKQASTVALDTYSSIGCAVLLRSWVNIEGVSIGTSTSTETGTRFKLADTQNCHVFGNFEGTATGLSGCGLSKLTINGNRTNNATAGSGIFIASVYSNTTFDNIKIGDTREHGIEILNSSTPIWMTNILTGNTGKNGVYIGGASTQAAHFLNVQNDNSGVNGTGESGLYVNVGSTENTQILITNYRFEQNITAAPTASDIGIQLNNLAGASVTINGAYGFSNDATATDFIKITTSTGRVNAVGVTCNNNYTNVFNDAVSGRVIAHTTAGIPAMFETMQNWNGAIFRSKSANNIGIIKQNSGALDINNSADGSTANDVALYGPNTKAANFDDSTATGAERGRTATESVLVESVADSTSAVILAGPGTPEARGDAVAPVGSIYLRTDGGAGTSIYIKESGAGNTGWVAK